MTTVIQPVLTADMEYGDANGKAKILNGDSGTVVHEKKKRRKVKRTTSMPSTEEQDDGYLRQVSSYSYAGEHPARHVQLPLETMGSREKLIHIHDELNNTYPSRSEINHDEKDIRKLALHLAISRSSEGKNNKFLHHDYVLVHKTGDNRNLHEKLRKKYESELHAQGFRVDRKYTADKTFVVLHCSFERLCEEAEKVSLEMPLAGVSELGLISIDGCLVWGCLSYHNKLWSKKGFLLLSRKVFNTVLGYLI